MSHCPSKSMLGFHTERAALAALGALGERPETKKALGIVDKLIDTTMQPNEVFMKMYGAQLIELKNAITSLDENVVDVVNVFISRIYERAGMIAAMQSL